METQKLSSDEHGPRVLSSVPMTEEEEQEAVRLARIAAMVEAKANVSGNRNKKVGNEKNSDSKNEKVTFLTKEQREKEALERLKKKRESQTITDPNTEARLAEEFERKFDHHFNDHNPKSKKRQREDEYHAKEVEEESNGNKNNGDNSEVNMNDKELQKIRDHYLGKKRQKRKILKPSEKFSRIFQFEWEEADDTTEDLDPLYRERFQINTMFGRGYMAGYDMREQRKQNSFLQRLTEKRQEEQRKIEDTENLTKKERKDREIARKREVTAIKKIEEEEMRKLEAVSLGAIGKHWSEKELSEMTDRDWRIFREDFDIIIKGGRASLPLRFWKEANLPDPITKAIKELGYKEPTPIQRQAIPIGLERRDIIGIAETGSGKTASFVIPLINYILDLPKQRRAKVADEGPLALIMAPTRELAQQIEEETIKLCKFTPIETCCVVGGQPIEEQGFKLRQGVDIVIGTPGRLNDCLESRYLVLNQCNYVVLDEADRMIDMGFEPQVIEVLESMGGLLKSENEEKAYEQAELTKAGEALYRVTSMFSATMPAEVERMATTYLRHPAIISIGDQDSRKNKRIDQHVIYTTEGQKKTQLMEILRQHEPDEKLIIFVNVKKNADSLGRTLEQQGIRTGVFHGGRSQEQREQTLELFRTGSFSVLVATDVAGRGLDIPDVVHIVNYDMPNKIDAYCHRIGRTGRAGKQGKATSFLTDHDEDVMYDLKQYLIGTEMPIPPQLSRHPAAAAPAGARREDGSLISSRKRDTIIYAK